MTRQLATILADKLDRGDEALGALNELADQGERPSATRTSTLGDKLGWKGIVAHQAQGVVERRTSGTARTDALRGAFERFAEIGRDADAVTVAMELTRTKGADRSSPSSSRSSR